MGINIEAYENGRAFGAANVRTYGLPETERVLAAARACPKTIKSRFDWLTGFGDAVDEAKRTAAWYKLNPEDYRVNA